jgi:hypothetical protein
MTNIHVAYIVLNQILTVIWSKKIYFVRFQRLKYSIKLYQNQIKNKNYIYTNLQLILTI